MATKRAAQRRANARPKPPRRRAEPTPTEAPAVVMELGVTFNIPEAQWLVAKLGEIAIPTAQGKMIAASIQAKIEGAAEALDAAAQVQPPKAEPEAEEG